jgi:hypothetical protein
MILSIGQNYTENAKEDKYLDALQLEYSLWLINTSAFQDVEADLR